MSRRDGIPGGKRAGNGDKRPALRYSVSSNLKENTMRFEGTARLRRHPRSEGRGQRRVLLRRPLLVKGEPGTGKTVLARGQIASALDAPLIEWNIKSTTKAQQGLYEYDAVARLRDAARRRARARHFQLHRKGKLWEAFTRASSPSS
jgi:type II secretory pathway predicted ATPase ExeA